MNDAGRIKRLREFCHRWGGELHVRDARTWPPGLTEMQFSGGRVGHDWEQRHVYIETASAWPYAIHEMAHVFAMALPTEDAGPVEPVGWQLLMACQLDSDAGLLWMATWRLYGMGLGTQNFKYMAPEQIAEYLMWQTMENRARGLIEGLTPVSIRKDTLCEGTAARS